MIPAPLPRSGRWPFTFPSGSTRRWRRAAQIPSHSDLVTRLDYEVELAVILGKSAKNVRAENAADYIFGYTILNDVSARDVQTGPQAMVFRQEHGRLYAHGPR